jgi:hypothetical protein
VPGMIQKTNKNKPVSEKNWTWIRIIKSSEKQQKLCRWRRKKKKLEKNHFQKEETSREDRLNIRNNCKQKVLLTSHLKKESSQNQLKIKEHEYTLVTCLWTVFCEKWK